MSTPLTPRQRDILDHIVECQASGFTPTIREMCSTFGIASPQGIVCHLDALERKGCIVRGDKQSRIIKVIDDMRAYTLWGVFDM